MSRDLTGIDIAHHQLSGPFDPSKLPESVTWLYIRTTYGVRLDREFEAHFAEAREKRPTLRLGPYHFFRQTQRAQEQWVAWRDAMDRVDIRAGDLAPCLDLEWNEQFDGKVDPAIFNTAGKELAERIRGEFGECMIYMAPGFFQTLREPSWLLDYPWWIAHYNVETPWCPWKDWNAWQFGVVQTGAYASPIDGNTHRGDLVLATKTPSWELDEVAPLPPDHGGHITEPSVPGAQGRALIARGHRLIAEGHALIAQGEELL